MNADPVDCREWCYWCQGDYWKNRRNAEKELRPPWCERCGLTRSQSIRIYGLDLDLHHRTYIHKHFEPSSDFELICRRCHDLEHGHEAKIKKWAGKSHPERPHCEWIVREYGARYWAEMSRQFCLMNPNYVEGLKAIVAPMVVDIKPQLSDLTIAIASMAYCLADRFTGHCYQNRLFYGD